jgi:hypothetical protein
MKLLWSGTWTSGSITVPELDRYNVLLFVCDNSSMGSYSILASKKIGNHSNEERWISGSTAFFEQKNVIHVVGIELVWTGSETKLSVRPDIASSGNYPVRSVGVGSGRGAGFITSMPVNRIYGVL